MENLPTYISIVFGLITIITVLLFYRATQHSKLTLIILFAWLALQTLISLTGFYTVNNSLPPRIALLGFPALLCIIILFSTSRGRQYIDQLDPGKLTILHTIRVAVELVLLWLFIHKAVPQLMTFEGRNFDILSGLSAPFIYYFGFVKKSLGKTVILIWNFICLGLLLNILINAVLSVPTPLQQFAFDQPNIAILYFPFVWLPCCVVPIVLLSHLAVIRNLTTKKIVT
jgi:hypothetical protein